MFATTHTIKGGFQTTDKWVGTYRGGSVVVKQIWGTDRSPYWRGTWERRRPRYSPDRAYANEKTIETTLGYLKYETDWFLWALELSAEDENNAEEVSEEIDLDLRRYHKESLAQLTARDLAGFVRDRMYEEAQEEWPEERTLWWFGLRPKQRLQFVLDHIAWLQARGKLLGLEAGEKPAAPKGPPLKPKPKRKPKPDVSIAPTPAPPEEHVPRRFGYCRRCAVCLAFDVNEGCCTVCGAPLHKNPPRKKPKRKGHTDRRARLRRLLRSL